ncbi:Acetolactate synthase large subunit [Serratia plymuthica]|nr:Acetolactate synthase large subunit [Serratia plymuthica]VEI20611.1 Acetolactate synthase large subunit [Serratia plymuthica]
MKVTDAILEMLTQEGIGHLFCVPGQLVDPFLESLANNERCQTIIAAHEAGAAYMADGYSRASRRFGVCLAISGPGITNMITALATANTDGSPVLTITGTIRNDQEERGAFQGSIPSGLHGIDITAAVTNQHLSISSPSQIWRHLQRLLYTMLGHATRGPVHLSIPVNVQNSQVEGTWQLLPPSLYHPRFVDQQSCNSFWSTVGERTRVAILAGAGCVHSDASAALIAFAERYHIPVATTAAAKGVFPDTHPLSLGVFGWFGHDPATRALATGTLDVLFVLGSRLHMLDTLAWNAGMQPRHALIVNDINNNTLFREYPVDLAIQGDARICLETLMAAPEPSSNIIEQREHWITELKPQAETPCEHPKNCRSNQYPIHPARAISALRQVMPEHCMLFTDSGAHAFFAGHYWQENHSNHCFSTLKFMGAMGWAIPAAIGAMLARPDSPCVVVTGDGCMLMHGIEIQTAARYHIPLICVVLNNSALGNPKLRAARISPAMENMFELPTHDWAGFARSLGAEGITIEHAEELVPAFQQALAANVTIVIDIRVGNYPTPTESFDKSIQRHINQ